MAKCYPLMDIKCNDCGAEVSVPIIYADDADRWSRMLVNPIAQIPADFQGWNITFGIDKSDYCPTCVQKQKDAIPQPVEPISS